MFTPEDELDLLDQDIGRLRRRLWDCERSQLDGRMTDPVERWKNEQSLRLEIMRLEGLRSVLLAEYFAAEDAWRESA